MKAFKVVCGVLLLASCSGQQSGAPAVEDPAGISEDAIRHSLEAITAPRMEQAASEADNWITTGRTYSEERFSPLAKINASNAGQVGLAWELRTTSRRGLEATPLVIDGVMFTSGVWNVVYALDARTGKLIWQRDPLVNRQWSRNTCCDAINRGLAAWGGKLFMGTLDGRLIALDAATGKIVWDVDTRTDPSKPYSITGAPRVIDGKIIIGNSGADMAIPVRGYVSAYDVQNGKLLWRFFTVPAGPNGPFEDPALQVAVKTWDPKGVFGGGTAWDSFAYDPALRLLYVGVGNGSPWASYRRSPRGGDNLYLSSILALNVDTGKLVWHYQTTPGESWDYTATQHMILTTLNLQGQPRDVLMQAPKNGFFYVLDRKTGELLSAEQYTTVTWATGVDLKSGRPILSDSANYRDHPVAVYPSAVGGHNWHPMAYSPETGLVYIPAMEAGWAYSNRDGDVPLYLGGIRESADALKRQLKGRAPAGYGGYLRAWDPVRQKLAWEVSLGGIWNGGVLATAGYLVFQGTGSGKFNIYDARDGRMLKSINVGTGIIAAPISYAVRGEQYVAVLAGWGGAQMATLERDSAAAKFVNEGRVLAFRLGGGEVPMPAPLPPRAIPEPPASPAQYDATGGKTLYSLYCGACHGDHGMIGILPDLRALSREKHEIFKQIALQGAFVAKGMPSFAGILTEKQVDDIHAHLLGEQRRLWAEQQLRTPSTQPTPELAQ